MDILRKELNQIYLSQALDRETLDPQEIEICRHIAESVAKVSNACCVITDASQDRCHLFAGNLAIFLGLSNSEPFLSRMIDSSDEDIIYTRIHPEDLVEKRMLEYEYFKFVDVLPPEEKLGYKATCRIRIKDKNGNYITLDNSTQIMKTSPSGKIWLILCCYDLSPVQEMTNGIDAHIKNNKTGDILPLVFSDKKNHILTTREKEILLLVKEGRPSKQIAGILGISINTVSRHRQNILEKLSVGNSLEAVTAATSMGLIP